MSASNKDLDVNKKDEQMVDVLYQKIGNQWYSFYVMDDEVVMGAVSEETVHAMREKNAAG